MSRPTQRRASRTKLHLVPAPSVDMTTLAEQLLTNDRLSANDVTAGIQSASQAKEALVQLAVALGRRRDPIFRARVLRLAECITTKIRLPSTFCAQMLGFTTPAAMRQGAFDAVAESVAQSMESPRHPTPAAILHDQVVWVTTPVRMDFAGGWSDTPPISNELGGTVVNAAITLNGQYPVQVMAKLNQEGVIRLASIDLSQRISISTTAELVDHSNPEHWAALPKAALVLAGIGPGNPKTPLRKWLTVLGGGLDLTIFSALPKGSGMGTSSILGAAVLACLDRVLGVPYSADRLITMTSILEQRMCTGGGWQDQIGGIVPGVKLIRTKPGGDQTPSLSWSVFDLRAGSALRERTLLYFTGQKRMARNILHNVVLHYLARDPHILETVNELKNAALDMKAHLDAQDVDGFARGVERYWTLKKKIDPGATNPQIEALLKSVSRWTEGRLLPGAGGGGFILLIAKDAAAAQHIRRYLTAHPPNTLARFFDFDVDQTGLKVTVL
jgi:galactokinase/mevalonate kinase-like predicted kinase